MELNRKFKFNEEVFIYAFFDDGLPVIEKGRVCGMIETSGIFKFKYLIDVHGRYVLYRFPNAIFKSVDEMQEALKELVVKPQ